QTRVEHDFPSDERGSGRRDVLPGRAWTDQIIAGFPDGEKAAARMFSLLGEKASNAFGQTRSEKTVANVRVLQPCGCQERDGRARARDSEENPDAGQTRRGVPERHQSRLESLRTAMPTAARTAAGTQIQTISDRRIRRPRPERNRPTPMGETGMTCQGKK